MKSILFISLNDHVPWGGSEELWSKTAVHLAASLNVKILIKEWQPEPAPIQALKTKKLSIFYKYRENKQSIKNRLLKRLFGKPYKKTHHLELNGIGKPDLVVISLGNHSDLQLLYYANYLNKHNIPYVLVFQLVTDLRGFAIDKVLQFKACYTNAKQLYFLSQDNIDKAEMQLATVLKNKAFINNPFNYTLPYTLLHNDNTKTFNLGCVAALNLLHKGLDVFLKTLSNNKWKQRNIHINFYGTGVNKDQVTELIELYGLSSNVSLIGFVSNKETIWKHNHGLILPSRMEGQSLAMLEAMAHGRMVISTKVGDAERLVKPNETGFLIEAPTVELIDAALEKAWERRADWIEMGKLSRKHLFATITKDPVEDFAEKLQTLL